MVIQFSGMFTGFVYSNSMMRMEINFVPDLEANIVDYLEPLFQAISNRHFSLLFLNMGCAASKDGKKDKSGARLATKGLMGAAKLGAKVGANEIGDMGDLGDAGEFLEGPGGDVLKGVAKGAAKAGAKAAVKAVEKQIEDKDDKKSDHDKKKDNTKLAGKLVGAAASIAVDAALENN